MTKVYACLAGNWVCLNDDPECVMGEHRTSPSLWYEESALVCASCTKVVKGEYSYTDLEHVKVLYRGRDWRVNPLFIQVVSE